MDHRAGQAIRAAFSRAAKELERAAPSLLHRFGQFADQLPRQFDTLRCVRQASPCVKEPFIALARHVFVSPAQKVGQIVCIDPDRNRLSRGEQSLRANTSAILLRVEDIQFFGRQGNARSGVRQRPPEGEARFEVVPVRRLGFAR